MNVKRGKLLYFCDESSQDDRFMAVGGLAVTVRGARKIASDIQDINLAYHLTSELKWSTAKQRRKSGHKAYIDYLFSLIEANMAHLHIRFAPFKEYDHSLSGKRKKIDTVSKMHYQLLLHRAAKYYGGTHDIYIRPDDGDCTNALPGLLSALNNDAGLKFRYRQPCVTNIECRRSCQEPLLQLLDVTLGALTAYRNDRHLKPQTSDIKRLLAPYAFGKLRRPSLAISTPIDQRQVSIWNVQPKWKKGRGPRG